MILKTKKPSKAFTVIGRWRIELEAFSLSSQKIEGMQSQLILANWVQIKLSK
jgi:hypothetical protein